MALPPAHWGLAARGALVEAGGSTPAFDLADRDVRGVVAGAIIGTLAEVTFRYDHEHQIVMITDADGREIKMADHTKPGATPGETTGTTDGQPGQAPPEETGAADYQSD